MVTSSSAAKGAPRLTTVKITSDGIEHTRQVDGAQLEAYDEQGVDYVKVPTPMTGLEHLPEPLTPAADQVASLQAQIDALKGQQPANKAGAPGATK